MEHHDRSEALITKTDAARIRGLSVSTICRLVDRGVLEEVQLADGMRPRLRLADVLALGQQPPAAHEPHNNEGAS